MHPPPGHPARLAQGLEETAPVLTVAEDRLAAIAPRHDVVKGTFVFNADAARQKGLIAGNGSSVSVVD